QRLKYFIEEGYQDFVIDRLQGFLEQYGDGALVAFVLLQTIAFPPIRDLSNTSSDKPLWGAPSMGLELRRKFMDSSYAGPQKGYSLAHYPGYTMVNVPAIVGKEPLEVALVLERLAGVTSSITYWPNCAKYFWRGDGKPPTRWYPK